jgi:hypothetical protein
MKAAIETSIAATEPSFNLELQSLSVPPTYFTMMPVGKDRRFHCASRAYRRIDLVVETIRRYFGLCIRSIQ